MIHKQFGQSAYVYHGRFHYLGNSNLVLRFRCFQHYYLPLIVLNISLMRLPLICYFFMIDAEFRKKYELEKFLQFCVETGKKSCFM